uniref:NOP protein chaperone 1 n=1 Tax=Fundulus heteroclitus TaxID=8078 RepID=A0A3Q2TDL7_FUNHE
CVRGGARYDPRRISRPTTGSSQSLQTCFDMAEANEKLKQQMEEAPEGRFDIENVDEAERIIEMDVALVELNESDSDSEDDEESEGEESDSESDVAEVTEKNLKLPGDGGKKKANIQVLEQPGE